MTATALDMNANGVIDYAAPLSTYDGLGRARQIYTKQRTLDRRGV